MVHVVALEFLPGLIEITIHLLQAAQIAALKQDKAPIKVWPKYANYADVFSFNLAIELPKNTGIKEHAIELQDSKQPLYRPIYSLGPVKLETLKTYNETHLKIGFIRPFKSPAGAPILFDKKPDSSFWLYINYQVFKNLPIKNRYPLVPIGKALDRLGRAKQFI